MSKLSQLSDFLDRADEKLKEALKLLYDTKRTDPRVHKRTRINHPRKGTRNNI
jgi:hypothetical protein